MLAYDIQYMYHTSLLLLFRITIFIYHGILNGVTKYIQNLMLLYHIAHFCTICPKNTIALPLKHTHTHSILLHYPTHHRKLSAFLHFQKTSLMINKLFFPSWQWKCHKDKHFGYCHLCGDILSHNVGFTRTHTQSI